MNHIFGCPMHYGVGDPGLINSLDYLQSFCPELDIDILPEITRSGSMHIQTSIPTKPLSPVISTECPLPL